MLNTVGYSQIVNIPTGGHCCVELDSASKLIWIENKSAIGYGFILDQNAQF